jgi:glycosyltransferase involved in cell wall biosynthesis
MTLRVGIDATAWENPRGDGRFVRNAVRRLVALYPALDWTLYVDAATVDEIEAPNGARLRAVTHRRRVASGPGAKSTRSPVHLARQTLAARRRDLDAFLSPSVYNYFPVIGVPSVVGLHDATATTHARLVLPSRRDRVLWGAKQRLALRLAGRLFTVSETSRAAISSNLGLPASAIAVVPEAADPVFTPQPRAAIDSALTDIGVRGEQGYLVFAAGMSPHKGLDTLVEAFASLRESRPAPPLIVAGSSEGPYPSLAKAVRERVRALGLEDAVRFPGFLSDHALACLYSAATAAIVPSLTEGFGLSAIEAAACGAPVVLSDIGAHRETLGDAGLLFPPGNRRALHERLEQLLSDRDEGRRIGERARTEAGRYSWDETAGRLHDLLLEAARRR